MSFVSVRNVMKKSRRQEENDATNQRTKRLIKDDSNR